MIFILKNVSFGNFLNGFKHTQGHINNFYFNYCTFSDNYDNGFVVNSRSAEGQVNWFTMIDCVANQNGFNIIGNELVVFVNDQLTPNYDKGVGFKINGTSHNLSIGGHINATAGILIPDNYIYGSNISGYFEQSGIADLICLVNSYAEWIRDTLINIYSAGDSYYFVNENIRRLSMPIYYCKYLENKINEISQRLENANIP